MKQEKTAWALKREDESLVQSWDFFGKRMPEIFRTRSVADGMRRVRIGKLKPVRVLVTVEVEEL